MSVSFSVNCARPRSPHLEESTFANPGDGSVETNLPDERNKILPTGKEKEKVANDRRQMSFSCGTSRTKCGFSFLIWRKFAELVLRIGQIVIQIGLG